MPSRESQTQELVHRAVHGDRDAMEQLMALHRDRLRRMVAVRIDQRLASRVDPSDVVQDTLAEAARKLPGYVKNRSLPFFPWLREIAWQQLVDLHRQHVRARRRSVSREEPLWTGVSDESAMVLAKQLAAGGTNPSTRLVRDEVRARVRSALDQLAANDREVLVMRYLEQLKVHEVAAILGISEAAVKMRCMRAFERLRQMLGPHET